MVVNAIAPWEGRLVWVGTPNGGFTQSGEEWKSVDFVLSYTDGKLQERNICLNAFGTEKVAKLLSTPIGTTLRVVFQPTAREYNEKWFGKNEAFWITVVQPQQTAPAPQPQYVQQPPQYQQPAPSYPQYGTQIPPQAPAYQQPAPQYQQPVSPAYRALTQPEEDLPI